MSRFIKAFLLLLLASSPAFAGSATIGYTPGTGVNFAVTTDGGGNYNSRMTICDFSACANGLGVDASGRITVVPGNTANTTPWLVNLSQAGAAISATNGLYTNLLQGNAVISATNGIFANILQGNVALSATNGSFTNILQGNAVLGSANGLFVQPITAATWSVVGATSNATSAVATSATNVKGISYNYGFNGTTWDQLQVDGSKNLNVNCAVGCSAGAVSNAGSGVATSSTNVGSVAWNYGFNGTTWDQLQVDASKFLKVNCAVGCGGTGIISNATFLAPSSTSINSIAYGYIYQGPNWVQMLADGSGYLQVNTAAGGIQGFAPGTVWSGSNGVGLAAGEQHVGETGANGGIMTSSALGVTAVSHTAGTCLGTLVTFSNSVRNNAAALTSGTSGIIQNIVIGFASSGVPSNLDAIFFTSNPGTNPCNAADGATYTLATGDIGKALPPVHLSDLTASATGYLMQVSNLALRYGLTTSTTLYGVLVVRGSTFTPATGTTLNIGVFRD